MKQIFCIGCLLTIMWTASSQNVIIHGTAPGAEGRFITLSTPSDLITNAGKTLAKATVDSSGKFSLPVNVDKTIPGELSIDFHTGGFFIEPGKTYEVRIAPYNYSEIKELNPFINSTNLHIELINLPLKDINFVIGAFDGTYNAFLVENFNALYRDHNKLLIDTLKTRIRSEIGEPTDQYVKNYIEYKLANLIQLTQLMSPAMIGNTYFTTKPVLYENVEYMDFFNTYFSKYLTATSRILKKNDYHALFSGQEPYSALMKALEADSIIKPEKLRELVLLKGLMEMYNTATDDQKRILAVLNTIEQNSKEKQNRLIASNIKKILSNLQPGTPAPLFQLRNKDNSGYLKLDSLRGKVVVLNFWTSYCVGCTNEMDLIKPIAGKYKGKVAFISISSEYSRTRMCYYVKMKKDWDWTFLHIGDQIDVLKAYDVRSLPLFVIIDKQGNLYKYSADFPSNGLENSIEQLLQSSK